MVREMDRTQNQIRIGNNMSKNGINITRSLIATVLMVIFSSAFAQTASFSTGLSANKVGLKDRFYVTYTSNKKGSFIQPKYKDFTIVSGVSQGSSSRVSIVNGKMSQSMEYTFRLTLQPKKEGVLEVEGASIKVGNETIIAKPVKITVVKESQARQRRRSIFDDFFGDTRRQQQPPQEIDDKSFFCKITLSKSTAYVNEHVVAKYKIYSKNLRFGLEKYDFPTHPKFWTEDIKIPDDIKPTEETIDGVRYQVYTLKKEILFPQEGGRLALKPFSITARINQSVFSNGVSKEIKSNVPVVIVNELPSNAPSPFVNQVGSYSMNVDVSVEETGSVDEPIDFEVTVKGKGNLKQMSELDVKFPEGLEVYDPESKERISVSEGGVKGSKSYSYLLIPRKAGKYVLSPIAFSYFDLKTKKYKTIYSKEIKLDVLNADGTSNSAVMAVKDSSHISDAKNAESAESEEGFSLGFLLVPLGVMLSVFLVFFFRKRGSKEETEEEKRRNARKRLAKRLEKAKSHLDRNEIDSFYDETLLGINMYVNDKLQIQTSDMTKESIISNLSSRGVDQSIIDSFVQVIQKCEMAKYSPLSNDNNSEIYSQSLDAIERLENSSL